MKGLQRSLKNGVQELRTQTISLDSFPITVDGATGVGWGTAVIAGLPEGNIMLLGAVANIKVSTVEATGIVDTFNGDFGIGTTPADDGTITAGDIDIIPSTALGPAVAKVTPIARGVQADGSYCGVVKDNTDSSLELNLNLLIDDADISADDLEFTVDGILVITYVRLGDD